MTTSSHSLQVLGGLAVVTVVGGSVAAWGARDLLVAKRCLDGQLHFDVWSGATISEEGCEITTESGDIIVIALHGPSLGWFLAAAVVTALSLSAMVAITVAHRARGNPRG